MVDINYLRENFIYKDGFLYRKSNMEKICGTPAKNGYLRIGINNKRYYLHRIIWMINYGHTDLFIDHKDLDKTNNEISNLRISTYQENLRNRRSRSLSGQKGVYFDKSKNKWLVSFRLDYKQKYLGRFANFDDAVIVAKKFIKENHREFANYE